MKVCSIVTVTYKDPTGFSRTYRSIQGLLTNKEIEWIVVDSSPEMNRHTIEEIKKEVSQFKYIVSEPKGIYAAMNLGVQAAEGSFLWFLNGGDELTNTKDFLHLLYEGRESDLILGSIEFTNDKDKHKKIIPAPRNILKNLLGVNRVCHQSVLYSKRLFSEKEDLYNLKYKIAADYLHLLKSRKKIKKVFASDHIIAKFYKGGASQNIFRALEEFWLVHWHNEADVGVLERLLHFIFFGCLSLMILFRRLSRIILGLNKMEFRHEK